MLAGDADRERAAEVLKAAFAEGRLRKPEYDHRLSNVLAARTVDQLRHLTSDLPVLPIQPGAVSGAPHVPPGTWPPPPYVPPPAVRQPPTNGSAVGSLVCGLLTPVTFGLSGVPAIYLGTTARREIRRTGERGDGLAVAGVTVGWIGLAALVLGVLSTLVV